MLIFGRHDYYIANDVAEELAAKHPEAEIVWLEESGHMGFYEEPEKCAEAILRMALK
jgi:pimeloyl-ACP methyl ester carboxylesterase